MLRFGLLLFVTGLPALAFAHRTGITGYSGKATKNCTECHTAFMAYYGDLRGSANRLEPGKKGTYTFTAVGLAGAAGGVDVGVSGGTLSVNVAEPKTKLVGNEIVHAEPKAANQGVYTWTFDWTAPMTPGTYTIYVAALDGNNNNANIGDTTFIDAHTVEVGPCVVDVDCDDGNVCTTDTCDANHVCQHVKRADCCLSKDDCVDTDPCTADECDTTFHKCSHRRDMDCCYRDDDCMDVNPCTQDTCDQLTHRCTFPSIPNCCSGVAGGAGQPCDDGSRCTTDECQPPAGQNTYRLCTFTPITGCCLNEGDCTDNNPCTQDRCNVGTCLYTKVSDCCTSALQCDDKNSCTQDYCNASNKCEHKNISGCTSTGDGGVVSGDGGQRDGSTAWSDGSSSRLDSSSRLNESGIVNWSDYTYSSGDQASSSSSDGCCRVSHASELPWGVPLLLLGLGMLAAWQRRRTR